MTKPDWLKQYQFSPVIKLPEEYYVHDFRQGEDPLPSGQEYSVGRYNEVRQNMYTSELFTKDKRNIHMGVDIAAPVGEKVFSFYEGELFLFHNNDQEGDYGPTLIVKYSFEQATLYALYGHLSLESLQNKVVGQKIKQGEVLGTIGDSFVNGGWFPHLHFQLSLKEPKTADMLGVVSELEHKQALKDFPDPQWVLGPLYS